MEKRNNLSIVQYGVNDLRLVQTPLPHSPGPNDVQLSTHTVGICGSDIHLLTHGVCAGLEVKKPYVCGHESSAVVVEVGSNVKHLKTGDRVAVEPGVPCDRCEFCREGTYNLCRDVIFHATPPVDGSLRRFYNHSSRYCFKIPDDMTFGEGALIEPLAVAVHACQMADIGKDKNTKILVTGAGTVGLLCALTAKAYGVSDICIIDINESRLKFAKQMGIEKTLLISVDQNEVSIARRVVDSLGQSPNITFECTGVELCLNIAIESTREGGTVLMVGLNHSKVNVSLNTASMREIHLIGVKRYRNCYPLAISLVSDRKVNVKPLISNVYAMEDGIKAFETAKNCGEGVIKVQIVCQ